MTRFRRPPADTEPTRERLLVDVHASAESGGGFVAAALLAVAVFFMLAAYSAHQVTSRERADDLLGAGIATTTEVDLLLAESLPLLRERAAAEPAELYDLPGYPLDVQLTHTELTTYSTDQLRELLISRSVGRVYENGLTAFDRTGSQDFGFFSVGSAAEQVVGQITEQRHSQAGWIAAVLAVFCAIASVTVVVMYEGFRRFRALGMAFLLGAVPGLVFTWLLALAVGRFIGSDPYSQDLEAIIGAILDVAQRNYLIVAILGLIVAVSGPALSFIAERLSDADSDDGAEYGFVAVPADAGASAEDPWYGYEEDDGSAAHGDNWEDEAYGDDDAYEEMAFDDNPDESPRVGR